MDTIGTFEAKTHLTRLLDRVAAGEQITITRHGTPIARLVPVKPGSSGQIRETIAKLKNFSERPDPWRPEGQGFDQRRPSVSGFVIDAPVALAWCFDNEATEATRALLDRFESEQAEVPSLWHLELANALVSGERHRRITRTRANEFIALIAGLPIVIDEQTPTLALSTILDLARSERLSTYDASYLELAMRRGLSLATKDNDLAKAAQHVGVTLLPTA